MTMFSSPPVRTPLQDTRTQSSVSKPWLNWFQAITNQLNAAPVTITGSRANPATFAELLTALAAQGIIVDETTP